MRPGCSSTDEDGAVPRTAIVPSDEPSGVTGVVTTSFPHFPGDFRGVFVADRVAALRAAGHRVQVVAAGPTGLRIDAVPDVAVSLFRVPSPLFSGAGAPEVFEAARAWDRVRVHLEALRFQCALMDRVARQLRHWDRVESHWLVPSAVAVAATSGLPHTAYCHSGDLALLERWPLGPALARWLVARCVRVVCVTADLARRLLLLCARDGGVPGFPHEIVQVASLPLDPVFAGGADTPINPVTLNLATDDLTRISPDALGCPPVFILAAGRLVPIKGFDTLVLALGRLPVRTRPALVILGDGPERARLQSLARQCGVPLHLPGTVPHTAVAAWLRSARLCVVSSRTLSSGRTEGLPTIAREAIAVGTPLVVTPTGGLPDFAATVGVQKVFLADSDRPAALAQALGQALKIRPTA